MLQLRMPKPLSRESQITLGTAISLFGLVLWTVRSYHQDALASMEKFADKDELNYYVRKEAFGPIEKQLERVEVKLDALILDMRGSNDHRHSLRGRFKRSPAPSNPTPSNPTP